MNRPDIEAIQARTNAATPEPWEAYPHSRSYPENIVSGLRELSEGKVSGNWLFDVDHLNRDDYVQDEGSQAACNDADFVANARTDIPALLEYIAHLEARGT